MVLCVQDHLSLAESILCVSKSYPITSCDDGSADSPIGFASFSPPFGERRAAVVESWTVGLWKDSCVREKRSGVFFFL